jgi:hypothetical protein
MEQEKDNFWMWIGAVIVATIIGVFILKSREMESVPTEGYAQTRGEIDKQIEKTKAAK